MKFTRHEGVLPSGSRSAIEVPDNWNGLLLLTCRPLPRDQGEPPWESEEDPLLTEFVQQGYALAGSANTIFWPLERFFFDQVPLIEEFDRVVAMPRHTIAWGPSIGGIMTAGLVQLIPDRLSGALPLCGNLAGAVAIHNRELDIAFVIKTLLAPDSGLELVRISDAQENYRIADSVLKQAQTTAEGRARLCLAAAVGNIPGWHDPGSPEPAADDVASLQRNQLCWFEEPGLFVYFAARAEVEQQAGGNPSWNTDVDYGRLLEGSMTRGLVEQLYEAAGLDLRRDLETLATTQRTDADADAVSYLERHIVFSGDLGGVPVLAVHTDGDGLVTPDNMRAYADVVGWAGKSDLLRQLYVHRGGHCTFTRAETLTALAALVERIETGSWPSLDPQTLNGAAAELPAMLRTLRDDQPAASSFFSYEPRPFPRPYDIRSTAAGEVE